MGGLIGLLSGFGLSFWISIGAYFYPPTNPTLPTSVDGCYESENVTFTTMTMTSTAVPTAGPPDPPIADLYHVSYMWYSAIGCLTVVVVGLITSFITGRTDPKEVNPKLFSPIVETVFCCIPESWRQTVRCGVELDYEDDLKEEETASGDYIAHGSEENQRKGNEKLELHIMNGVDTHL